MVKWLVGNHQDKKMYINDKTDKDFIKRLWEARTTLFIAVIEYYFTIILNYIININRI